MNYQAKNFSRKTPGFTLFRPARMIISSLKILIFFIFFLGLIPLSGAQTPGERQAAAKSQGPYKVAILPVAVHSPENLAFLREGLLDMLSSRMNLEGRVSIVEKAAVKKALAGVEGEIDAQKAMEAGSRLGADYVVFGSLTKLGDSASLDLQILSVKGEKPPASVYVQARKMEEIINGVDEVARKADEKILGYSLLPPTAQKPAAAPPPAAAAPAAPPAPAAALPAPPPPSAAPAPAARPAMGWGTFLSEFTQSPPLPIKVQGMAVADFDGDGKKEIALIDEKSLRIYRWEENQFKLLKRIEGSRIDRHLAVDAADLDKDGKAEIYVTSIPETAYQSEDKMSSYVVAFKDGEYRVAASGVNWFLRVVDWPGKGKVLLGQNKGVGKGFEGPIYELGWDGKRVKDGRKIEGPKFSSVYGIAPFLQKENLYFAYIDSDLRLKIADAKGNFVWKSNSYYASDVSYQTSYMKTHAGVEGGDEFSFVNVRVVVQGDEIVVVRNISPIADIFKRQKYFSGGEVQGLAWGGATLQERWKTREIAGYVADFSIEDMGEAGGRVLMVAVNLPKESVFSTASRSAVMVSRIQ